MTQFPNRTPLLLEADLEMQRRRRARHGGEAEDMSHWRSLQRSGREHEFFRPHVEAIKKADAAHKKAWEDHLTQWRAGEHRHSVTGPPGGRSKLDQAETGVHDAVEAARKAAHRVDHPIGQYIEGKKDSRLLRRLNHLASPEGWDTLHKFYSFSIPGMRWRHHMLLSSPDSEHHERHKRHLLHALRSHGFDPKLNDTHRGKETEVTVETQQG